VGKPQSPTSAELTWIKGEDQVRSVVDSVGAGGARAGDEVRPQPRPFSATSIWIIALVLAAGAWGAGRLKLYTPGSHLGYYMGLVGSVFMAMLLLYPLRKRLRFLQRAGPLRNWFRAHMFLGIAGPVLVMFHSTLKIGSLNAAVAFYSMILVAGSGIIGRFIYTKIHNGLYGRKATVQERQERLGLTGDAVKSKFHFAPDVERRLAAFEAYAMDESRRGMVGLRRFVAVALRARWLRWSTLREVRRVLTAAAPDRDWDSREIARRLYVAERMLREYLGALQDVAQFRIYERLFSLWHVLHVPFVYMLVICAIVHVVAVHMY